MDGFCYKKTLRAQLIDIYFYIQDGNINEKAFPHVETACLLNLFFLILILIFFKERDIHHVALTTTNEET